MLALARLVGRAIGAFLGDPRRRNHRFAGCGAEACDKVGARRQHNVEPTKGLLSGRP